MIRLQIIWANNYDGTRYCLFIRDMSFDVDAWAQSRVQAMRVLGIKSIYVEEFETRMEATI